MPAAKRISPSKRFCGTSFLLTEDESRSEDTLVLPSFDESRHKFLSFQQEICPHTGRKHVQFYVEFLDKLRYTQIKTHGPFWASAHLERCLGSVAQNIQYTKKSPSSIDGTFQMFGLPTADGVSNARQKGLHALGEGASLETIRTEHPHFYIQSLNAIERYIQQRDAHDVIASWKLPEQPFAWQSEILQSIDTPRGVPLESPLDRRVTWIYDPNGNRGKSTLVKMIIKKYGSDAIVMASCSAKRVIEAMTPTQHVVMLDLPRAYRMIHFNYTALEIVKDGLGARQMYHPGTKVWNNPHLLVFSNSLPDESQLTQDRWNIIKLDQ